MQRYRRFNAYVESRPLLLFVYIWLLGFAGMQLLRAVVGTDISLSESIPMSLAGALGGFAVIMIQRRKQAAR